MISFCFVLIVDIAVSGISLTMNFSSILPKRSKPASSSRWWFADVSAMVETMAM